MEKTKGMVRKIVSFPKNAITVTREN